MSNPITPYLAKMLLSPKRLVAKRVRAERQRKRQNQPHRVTVYLRINDPFSYLLVQVLENLAERYPLEYDFRTVLNLQKDMYPAPTLWETNAFSDSAYLAELYADTDFFELKFPAQAPANTLRRDIDLTAQLLHWELQPGYLKNASALFEAYWQNEQTAVDALLNTSVTAHAECYQHHLSANENLLKSHGHYMSATLHYGGEWYWGIDRLQYLERRLNQLGIAVGNQDQVVFDRAQRNFCRRMSAQQIEDARQRKSTAEPDMPIEMFFSIRSPYSYIGLVRARKLAEYYRTPLIVKPVLPMVMRRMQVPKTKSSYITADVKREAQQLGIPFGFIADPLGKGVENCYALYKYAQSEGKGIEFLEQYARGVWAEGIRSDTDKGLQQLVSRAGLQWNQAKDLVNDESWRLWAQNNLAELYANEQWGVPSFKFGTTVVFGQDRLDRIERAIVQNLKGQTD